MTKMLKLNDNIATALWVDNVSRFGIDLEMVPDPNDH